MTANNAKPQPTIAAGILIASAVLSVFVMLHHPTLGAPEFPSLADEAQAEAGLNGLVHGTMILIAIIFYFCLSYLSDRLGRNTLSVRAAQLSFAIATATMVGAALVSGFVVPDLASDLLRDGAEHIFRPPLQLLFATNQVLAKAGTIGYGAAIFFWSMALVTRGAIARVIGLAGIALGLALVGGIAGGVIHLTVHGMTMVVVAMGLWMIGAGIWMIRAQD